MSDWKDERVNELGRRRMRPLPADLYPFPEDWAIERIIKHGFTELFNKQESFEEKIMADLSKLQASVANLGAKVDALIADTTSQAAVDAIQQSVDAESAKIDAVLPPPVA